MKSLVKTNHFYSLTREMTALMLFHRDLRLVDHNALERIHDKQIIPLFIFTPEQVSSANPLKSNHSVQFMIESLRDLEKAIRSQHGTLYIAYGDTVEVLESIFRSHPFTILAETADYTPYAKKRTIQLEQFCKKHDISYDLVDDSYLLAPGSILNKSGKTFQKFTPFYEAARIKSIPAPKRKRIFHFYKLTKGGGKRTTRKRSHWQTSLDEMERRYCPTKNEEIAVKGGRTEGLQLVSNLPKRYAQTHNIPSIPTSLLSAHNHFGTVSIREVYAATRQPEFRRQLWWRDFYGHIMADFENLYGMGAYEFELNKWKHPLSKEKKVWLEQWEKGETGVDLVDAGIKQMLRTGWMHNRIRLVVSSWLTKDKGIHWRHGERFFAKHLVDYDPAQNMMNWIWMASALPFASAPFRKVSAKGTAEEFNKDEKYVNTWL
jgi:deoxyribodipyrimidine photo-lyase